MASPWEFFGVRAPTVGVTPRARGVVEAGESETEVMSERRHRSLSGLWTGVFDYPWAQFDPVPFNADLLDVLGALTGEIIEPNSMVGAQDAGPELTARIEGARDGLEVSFLKRYAAHVRHHVRYEGTANARLTRITGIWTTLEVGGGWSGPFVMDRRDDAERAEESRSTEAALVASGRSNSGQFKSRRSNRRRP